MSARLSRNWDLLKVLKSASPPQRKAILLTANDDLILAICEIVDNVLRGAVKLSPLQRNKLKQYKKVLRDTADHKISKKYKRKVIAQKGGFLPLILGPALALVAGLLGEAIGKRL